MKRFIAILFLAGAMAAQAVTPAEARKAFEACVSDEDAGKAFLHNVGKKEASPLIKGYKGAVMMIMAKHYFNPFHKLASFNSGREILRQAIESDPGNIELIWLRFSLQSNAPAFLNYNDHLEKDRTLLANSVKNIKDPELKSMILNYLRENDLLTDLEKSQLKIRS